MRQGGLDPNELQRRTARGVTWSTVSGLVSLPLAIVVSVVLARSLEPAEYARFAYLSFVIPLVLVATELGFAPATVREASRTYAEGDIDNTRLSLRKAVGWNLLRWPVVCAIVLAIAQPTEAIAIVVVVTLGVTMAGAGVIFALQAENRSAEGAKLLLGQGVLSSVASIVASTQTESGVTIWGVTLASTIFVVPAWYALIDPRLRRAALTPMLPRGMPAGFLRFAGSAVALAVLSTLVFSRSEIVILEALDRDKALAVFALAFGLSQRLTTPIDSLLTPLIPALSALESAHPAHLHAGFSRALRLSTASVAFLTSSAVIGTMFAAPLLFGSEYEATGTTFVALAVVSLVQSAAQPYVAVAHAQGRLGPLLRAYGVALVLDVALAFALIPSIGIWGAVIANVAGGLVAVLMTIRAVSFAGIRAPAGVPVRALVAVSGASALAAFSAGSLVSQVSDPLGCLVAFATGAGAFTILGRVSGGLVEGPDADAILRVLPPLVARAVRKVIPIRQPLSQVG